MRRRHVRLIPIATIVVSLSVLAICPSIIEANEIPDQLQGRWILTEIHQQDQVIRIDKETSGCTIANDRLTLEAGKVNQNYQITVDPGTTPPQLDAAIKTDQGLEVSPAVYELSGDRLRICFSAPGHARPEAFSTHVGEPHFMWVFRRPVEKPPFAKTTEPTPQQMKDLQAASSKLQGTWELTSMEWDGRKYPGKVTGRIVIAGDKATSYGGEKPITYALEINPHVEPAQLNLLLTTDNQLQIKQCIYSLQGDTLVLCHHFQSNKSRPKGLTTRASDGLLLTRLKRQTILQTGN